jgi:hypothetical protein
MKEITPAKKLLVYAYSLARKVAGAENMSNSLKNFRAYFIVPVLFYNTYDMLQSRVLIS